MHAGVVRTQRVSEGTSSAATESTISMASSAPAPELLRAVLDAAEHERQAEDQEHVGEDRADEGGLHDAKPS